MNTEDLYKPRKIKDRSPMTIYVTPRTEEQLSGLAVKYECSRTKIVAALLEEALEREMKDETT